jgi:hypothetical protein
MGCWHFCKFFELARANYKVDIFFDGVGLGMSVFYDLEGKF